MREIPGKSGRVGNSGPLFRSDHTSFVADATSERSFSALKRINKKHNEPKSPQSPDAIVLLPRLN